MGEYFYTKKSPFHQILKHFTSGR